MASIETSVLMQPRLPQLQHGPLLATGLFGYFISARAPTRVPGAAFFCGSLLMLFALLLALRSFRKSLPVAAAASA